MSDTPRCFVAVELESSHRALLENAIAKLEPVVPGARWSSSHNLHLTLKFIGDFSRERLPELEQRLAMSAARTRPFDLTLGGLGAFPHAREARVLWLGVTHGGSPLARLARKVDTAAGRLGVERDGRAYRAHLTLARLAQPGPIALERLHAPDPLSLRVERITLFESRLGAAGATHVPLARLPLGGAGEDDDFTPES